MTDYLDPDAVDITGTEEMADDYETELTQTADSYHATLLLSEADVERINAEVLVEASREQAASWRSPKYERERAEREQAAQERERRRAARVAAGGGNEVTTALRGEAGERVAAVLRLDEVASAASKLVHRVEDEAKQIRAEQDRGKAQRLDAVLEDAWADAECKRKVPDILGPLMRWDEHERLKDGPERFWGEAVERIKERHAERNHARISGRLDAVDAELCAIAAEVLEQAAAAADVLTTAGLTVDATAEQIVEQGDAQTLPAWKAWRDAVGRWGDFQSARRWVAVASWSGFDPRRPTEVGDFDPRSAAQRMIAPREAREVRLTRREALAQLEREVWRSQFGAALPQHIDSPAAALSWWQANGRPGGAGVHGGDEVAA